MENIEIKLAYEDLQSVKELFGEYTQMLMEADPIAREHLKLQSYDDELLNLEKKYGLPKGRLYIIYVDGVAAGCVGIRDFDGVNGELKRLYLRTAYRGRKLGEALMDKIISDAKEIGYKSVYLDSLPVLKSALKLYKKYGFQEIPPYSPVDLAGTVYMELVL